MTIKANADAEPALEHYEVFAARTVLYVRPTCFPAELGDSDIFLVAATDDAETINTQI